MDSLSSFVAGFHRAEHTTADPAEEKRKKCEYTNHKSRSNQSYKKHKN